MDRLRSADAGALPTAQRRARISYLAEARPLVREARQNSQWDRDQKG